ncbi:MAG: hypothetical protein ACI4TQ_04615 [Alloprevotella sp.]
MKTCLLSASLSGGAWWGEKRAPPLLTAQQRPFPLVQHTSAATSLKRAAVEETYPAVEESYPAVGTFFHGILFSPARAPLSRPAAPQKIDAT